VTPSSSAPALHGARRERQVDLLYFRGCPSHEAFLPRLRSLLAGSGVAASLRLVEIRTDDEAQREHFVGSPTVRVDGIDVEPSAVARSGHGMQCRLYHTDAGISGTPTDDQVLAALQRRVATDPPAGR